MTVVTFILLFVFLVIAVPVAYGLLIAGSIGVLIVDRFPIVAVAQRLYSPTQSFLLLAIPFFILAGELLVSGKLGRRLIDFASQLVGRFRGGHAQVSVVTSMLFAGVSGSAVADASGLGAVLIPWKMRAGYPGSFAAAVNASTATIGVIIPPSIPMIIYSSVSGVSVGGLFLAGLIPGVMLGVGYFIACYWTACRLGLPVSEEKLDWRKLARTFIYVLPAALMPIFILWFLIAGIATPTEVSVLAVFYALIVRLLYRDLTFKDVRQAVLRAGSATGVVMLLIMASSLVGWILTVERIPLTLTTWLTAQTDSAFLIILFMNVLMLFVGTFLDMPAAILLLGPVLIPLANAINLNLLQLGVMMTLNLAIGLFTPPVGTTLFISSSIARIRIEETVKALMPFYICALIVLLAISYIPALTITVGQ